MDGLSGDPLTHLSLTNNAHAEVVKKLMGFELPMLVTGGGGYHVENTVRAWALAWKIFCGDEDEHDLSMGMGGVMLGSSEWAGGLRDMELPVSEEQRRDVDSELERTIREVTQNIFPMHGIQKHT